MQLGPMQSVGDVRIPFPGVPVGGDLVARWGRTMPGQHWESLGVTPEGEVPTSKDDEQPNEPTAMEHNAFPYALPKLMAT